ncbi:MAG: hypothetical protein DWQ19_11880 [Crenarchaeota archaeon]|nr:MAG: hypothetical protein DWQ19_11880 [Thermoproteota archaeon]
MVATASDLSLVLTGGGSNSDPNSSLGGNPSSTPITGVLNNLFDNISDSEAISGKTDYRCIYLFNDSTSNTFYDTKLYIGSGATGQIQLGITSVKDVQKITIVGGATGGSFEIAYTPPGLSEETQTVNYNANAATWASNLETAINAISTLSADVVAGGTPSDRTFTITFTDYRDHDLLGLDISSLSAPGSLSGSISKVTVGAPINLIPDTLDADTTPPTGVTFTSPTIGSPLEIGTIYPEEGLPIWIKRTTTAGATATLGIGFTLKVSISPVDTS